MQRACSMKLSVIGMALVLGLPAGAAAQSRRGGESGSHSGRGLDGPPHPVGSTGLQGVWTTAR